MATESERSVDELLIRLSRIDQLTGLLKSGRTDELVSEARNILSDTQSFIDNNKAVIPAYSLKKITDSLRKLESKVNEPQKSSLQFKFKPSQPATSDKPKVVESNDEPVRQKPTSIIFGFRDKTNQKLVLNPDQLEYKDVSLINLNKCNVRLKGLANTVYICDLKDSTVIVGLACRAITIANCFNCHFKLVCQQLRIDSSKACIFEIFTSARSMLEASSDLEFREISFETLEDFSAQEMNGLLDKANFNRSQNNWRCVDDFDWLSQDIPSKNFRFST